MKQFLRSNSRRRKIFINPPFQWRFIVNLASIMILSMVSNFIIILYLFEVLKSEGASLGLPIYHGYFQFLKEMQWLFYTTFAFSFLFFTGIFFILIVIFSHKIAGPIFRLEKHIEAIVSGGQVKNFHLRNNDFFPEMADEINRLQDHLLSQQSVPEKKGE